MEDVEIRHVPPCCSKNQLPSLTPTQIVLFEKVYIKEVSRPPTTSRVNDYNVLVPRNEEGGVDLKRGVYETNNQPKKATFKYEQEVQFFLGMDKVKSKEDGTITGKRCPVFNYIGKEIFTIDAYKKETLNEFAIIRKLTLLSSLWVKKN